MRLELLYRGSANTTSVRAKGLAILGSQIAAIGGNSNATIKSEGTNREHFIGLVDKTPEAAKF